MKCEAFNDMVKVQEVIQKAKVSSVVDEAACHKPTLLHSNSIAGHPQAKSLQQNKQDGRNESLPACNSIHMV